MEPVSQNANKEEIKEFSLKELIILVKGAIAEVLRRWKWFIGIVAIIAAISLYRAITTPVTFPAKLSFMLNDDDSSALSGVGSILGSFGIGGGGSEYNLEKLMELSKTLKIIRRSLFEKVKIKNKETYMINHLIDLYDYHEVWEDDTTGLKDFYFVKDNFDQYQRYENKALKSIYGKIIGNPKKGIEPILKSKISEETGIMSLTVNSTSEDLSIQFVKIIFEHLSDFYVNKSVEKQKSTYTIVKTKVDSIKGALQSTEYALADFKDSSLGLISAKAKLKELQLQAKVNILYTMLGEATKNLEISDFTLKSKTPFVQLIDAPFPPIEPAGESKLKALLLGLIIGTIVAVGLILGFQLYQEAVKE
ncbi:MAG: hypothetical protein AB8G15_08400 [Saprospiraceae bacterium]